MCFLCLWNDINYYTALLKENTNPTEDEIKDYMRGNICRCNGYIQIVKTIKFYAEEKIILNKN